MLYIFPDADSTIVPHWQEDRSLDGFLLAPWYFHISYTILVIFIVYV